MQKFFYTLNAIHYSLFLMQRKSQMQIHEFVQMVLRFIIKFIGLEEDYNTRVKQRYENNKHLKDYMYGEKAGQSIGMAHHIFGYVYSGYSCTISFILLGFVERYWGHVNNFIDIIVTGTPIFLCYIPAYKALYTNDRYLSYFKKFKKENEIWHRKWKWVTLAFCFGSGIMFILGLIIMCIVLI